MSKFTTQLRFIVEQKLKDQGAVVGEENWPLIYDAIGLADYPIFQEAYRQTLNDKIIRHYYTREICSETVGRWRMFMRDTMHLIMPYYNQMYESQIIAEGMEPLGDRNIQRTEHAWGTAENTGTSTANTQDVFSDTPQSEMIPDQIKAMKYATNVTLDESSGNTSSSGSYDNMVEHRESGYVRPQAELLEIYRKTFLNIDRDIVDDVELRQCFMTIW